MLDADPSGTMAIGGVSSYALFALGWVLFGAASVRARVFPWIISFALVGSGFVGYLAAAPPFGVPLGLTVAWLGVWLLRRTRAARLGHALP